MLPFYNGLEIGFVIGGFLFYISASLLVRFIFSKRNFTLRSIVPVIQMKMQKGETRSYVFRFKKDEKGKLFLEHWERTSDLY